jgi:hypothetical protein
MTVCLNDERKKIGTAEELQIASLCSDGTLRNPVTISMSAPSTDAHRHGSSLAQVGS